MDTLRSIGNDAVGTRQKANVSSLEEPSSMSFEELRKLHKTDNFQNPEISLVPGVSQFSE